MNYAAVEALVQLTGALEAADAESRFEAVREEIEEYLRDLTRDEYP